MVNEEVGSVLIFLHSLKTQEENRLKRYHPTRHHSRQNRNKRVFKQNKYTIKRMNRKCVFYKTLRRPIRKRNA